MKPGLFPEAHHLAHREPVVRVAVTALVAVGRFTRVDLGGAPQDEVHLLTRELVRRHDPTSIARQISDAAPPGALPHHAREISLPVIDRLAGAKLGCPRLLLGSARDGVDVRAGEMRDLNRGRRDTATGSDAERLYPRLGWERCGVIPDYALWPDGGLCATTVFWKRV